MGGQSSYHVQAKIWNLIFDSEGVGVMVIFPYPGQIWNLKISLRVGRVGHLSMSRHNLKFKIFSDGWGVRHLTMSRPNMKFKIFDSEGWWGWSSFHIPGQKWNWKFIFGGLVIFPCPGPIWNLKCFSEVGESVIFPCPESNLKFKNFQLRMGGQSSFHVQAKSEIQNKIFGDSCGVSYLSMSRPKLKFKIKFLVTVVGLVIFPCPG